MDAFKIKKAFLVGLGNWINDLSLTGKQSRTRTRFVAKVQEELNAIDKERITIMESHAEKNEDGTVKKEAVDNGEKFVLSPEEQEIATKEYVDLLNEDYILDITEANREDMQVIKGIVLDTDYRFGPREGDSPELSLARVRQMNDYPAWCDAFEKI